MMRQVLQKRLEMMDMEMLPEQWKQLVEALDTAMWVEAKAETYDELVESRRSELNRGTWGGG